MDKIKELYPKGTRIRLISMNDSQAVPSGTLGTVDLVDDIGTIHVIWDNGRTLGLILGEDSFEKISEEEKNVDEQISNDDIENEI